MTGPFPPEVAHLPVCPRRGLPIPKIAEVGPDGVGHFTILDDQRAAECLTGRLCAMCGLPMGAEIAFLGDIVSLGTFWVEPPLHERCAELAAGGLCPFMSLERVPRRPPEDDVAVIGYHDPQLLAHVGRTVAKRPSVIAVCHTYKPALAPNGNSGGMTLVYVSGPPVRVRRYEWDPAGRAREVPAEGHWTGPRIQPRRTSRAQRRRS